MKNKILAIIAENLLALAEKLFADLYEKHAVPFLARQGYIVVSIREYDKYLRASRILNQHMITSPLHGNHAQRRKAVQDMRNLVTEVGTLKIHTQLKDMGHHGK